MADQWYVVYDKTTGEIWATATVISPLDVMLAANKEALPVPFNPQEPPPGDKDGRYEWNPTIKQFVVLSGAGVRAKRLESLRSQEDVLITDMLARGETVPVRAR